MKKNYTVLLLAAILSLNCMPFCSVQTYAAAASTESDDGILTVDEAVSKATAYSRTLKSLYEDNEINELDEHDTRRDLINSSEYIQLTNLNVELKRLMNSLADYDENVEIEKKSIRLNVIELFASIIDAEDSLKMYDKQIDINKRELNIADVKIKLGLISQSDYESLKLESERVINERQSLEIALEEAYTSLNRILGQDLEKRYTVSLDIEYQPLGEVSESDMERAVLGSQGVKQAEEAANIAKYQLDVYSVEYSGGRKETVRNNYAQAVRTLDDTKTNMRSGLRQVYNNIITAESNYADNLALLEQKQKSLEISALQLKLGKITQLEYDKAKYEAEQLENTIKQSVYSHYVLVCKFNDPDLI